MAGRIGSGLVMDRHMTGRFPEDRHRIDMGLADWQWLGGLAMDWQFGIGLADWRRIGGLAMDWQFGDGLVDWSRIDFRSAMDWRWMGGLVMD